jgi:putative ABC transport system substrate-binding protein
VLSASLPSRAHAASTLRRIGVLNVGAPFSQAELDAEYAPLRVLGWIVGQNLIVERRYASGRIERLQAMAEELVRLKVEIIVTFGTDATVAAKRATTTIPIVIHSSGDPVRTGLVASLARPGGNVTGFSMALPETDAKRVTLIRELLPGLQRVGVLEDSTNPYFRAVREDFDQKCTSLGIKPIFVEFDAPADIGDAIAQMARQRAQAILLNRGGKYWDNRAAIIGTAMGYAIPASAAISGFLYAGALLTYGNSLDEQYERQAAFVDRILRGAKPGDLPIEQPTRFELGINLKTAQALRIVVPQSLLIQAAEVIPP